MDKVFDPEDSMLGYITITVDVGGDFQIVHTQRVEGMHGTNFADYSEILDDAARRVKASFLTELMIDAN